MKTVSRGLFWNSPDPLGADAHKDLQTPVWEVQGAELLSEHRAEPQEGQR